MSLGKSATAVHQEIEVVVDHSTNISITFTLITGSILLVPFFEGCLELRYAI